LSHLSLTAVQWLVATGATPGFLFDQHERLLLPLVVALVEDFSFADP
jgi:hypothetical protein